MIKITVIAMSRLKEKYLYEACREYEKRLSRYCKLEVIEPEPERLPERPSESLIKAALAKEADKIRKKIPPAGFVAALCVEGAEMTSERFSSLVTGHTEGVTFIIGSSYGLDESLKAQADMRLSVSKMTFPHQLFRVMLLEQIYRGFKIGEGGEYHK